VKIPPIAIHETGAKVPVPEHIAHAAAWRVAAELIRRHPDDLYALELHPGMGQHDCIDLHVREGSGLGEPGSLFRFGVSQGGRINGRSRAEKGYPRFHWIDALFTHNLYADIIEHLERGEDIPTSPDARAINAKSIGAQVIATALAMRALSAQPLVAYNGVYDSSGYEGSGANIAYFTAFGSMVDEITRTADDRDLHEHPAYRFWFLFPAYTSRIDAPIMGIDSWNGLVWTKSVTKGDLYAMFTESRRDIHHLVAQLLHA
jgi:hypothetical protein